MSAVSVDVPHAKRRKVQQVICDHSLYNTVEFQHFVSHIRDMYKRTTVPAKEKWPHICSKVPHNLACIKKETVTRYEADAFTKDTIHGNVDDILNWKESMEISQVACLDQDGDFPDVVLIEGAPGIGKTTLALILCRSWSRDELLQQYPLVLLLRLRDHSVREAATIADLFQCAKKNISQSVIEEVDEQSGKGVLLILEGFDELPPAKRSQNSLFLDILEHRCLPLATKIVTSRPSATGVLKQLEYGDRTQHIEILGFRKVDIEKYITVEMKDQFRKYLSSYPHIFSMMYIPLNCAIVICVYKEGIRDPQSFIPKTSTQLYTALVKALLIRYLRDEKNDMNLKSIDDLPSHVLLQFFKLCKIAYDGIIHQQLIFSDLSPNFNTLGMMQSVPELYADFGESFSHNFLHLTVQEYLAAYHVFHLPALEQERHFRELLKSSHTKNMLIFLAGLSKFGNLDSEVLQSLLLASVEDKLRITTDSLHFLFEAQNPSLIMTLLGSNTVTFSPAQHPNPFDCFALGYCIASSGCSWEIILADCHIHDEELEMLLQGIKFITNETGQSVSTPLPRVSILDFRNNCLTSEILRHLTQHPFLLQKLTKLDLSKNKINADACTIMTQSLPLMPCMLNLCLSLNSIGNGGAVTLLSSISSLSSLEQLGLYDTGIGYRDIEALCGQLPLMHKLSLLDVGKNNLTPDSVEALIAALQLNISLKELAISYTALTPKNMSDFAKVVRTNHNLKALYLQGCQVQTDGAIELAFSLSSQESSLTILSLNENNIGRDGGVAFAEALRKNVSLVELRLVRNPFEEEATRMLVDCLEYNSTLQRLSLPLCYKSAVSDIVHQKFKERIVWH